MPLHLKGSGSGKPPSDPFALAKTLTTASPNPLIYAALMAAYAAKLNKLDKDSLLDLVIAQTGKSKQTIKGQFREIEKAAGLVSTDGQAALAQYVLEHHVKNGAGLRCAPDGNFWKYSGTHWVPIQENLIAAQANQAFMQLPGKFGEGKTAPTVTGAMAVLRNLCAVEADPMSITLAPPPVINLLNGELWLDCGEPQLKPHCPESGLICVLPVVYDPQATCPMFEAAVATIFSKADDPGGMVRHLLELIGYVIQPGRWHPHIVVFQGSGANGKSSILRIIQALLGKDQIVAAQIGNLSSDKFAKAELAGRLAYIDDDVKDGTTLDDGMLKAMAECKLLTARRAYGRRSFTFRSVALPILAMNNTPKVTDASHGFERRLSIFPFGKQFTKQEIDPTLFDKIIAEEMSGVLNLALAGLARLRARGKFDEPADAVAAKQEFMAAANPLQAFIQESLVNTPGSKIKVRDVYAAFRLWCTQNSIKPPFGRNSMKTRLESMGYQTVKSHPGLVFVMDVSFAVTPET